MIIRPLLEIALVLFIYLEVLFPLAQGRPLFPVFRRRRAQSLLKDLECARQDLDEDDIEEQVLKLRAAHKARQEAKEKTNESGPSNDIDGGKIH